MDNKEKFVKAEAEEINFEEDIIATSGPSGTGQQIGGSGEDEDE